MKSGASELHSSANGARARDSVECGSGSHPPTLGHRPVFGWGEPIVAPNIVFRSRCISWEGLVRRPLMMAAGWPLFHSGAASSSLALVQIDNFSVMRTAVFVLRVASLPAMSLVDHEGKPAGSERGPQFAYTEGSPGGGASTTLRMLPLPNSDMLREEAGGRQGPAIAPPESWVPGKNRKTRQLFPGFGGCWPWGSRTDRAAPRASRLFYLAPRHPVILPRRDTARRCFALSLGRSDRFQ